MVGHGKAWIRNASRGVALGVLIAAVPLFAAAGSAPSAKNAEASIPFANHGGIREWRADGSKGMWIEAASGHWFYASFSSQCNTLTSAIGLKFVPEPSGVLSRWSSIRLEHNERCFFRTLQPSDAPPKQAAPAKPDSSTAAPDKPTLGTTSHESALSAAAPVESQAAFTLASATIQELLWLAPLQVLVDTGMT